MMFMVINSALTTRTKGYGVTLIVALVSYSLKPMLNRKQSALLMISQVVKLDVMTAVVPFVGILENQQISQRIALVSSKRYDSLKGKINLVARLTAQVISMNRPIIAMVYPIRKRLKLMAKAILPRQHMTAIIACTRKPTLLITSLCEMIIKMAI